MKLKFTLHTALRTDASVLLDHSHAAFPRLSVSKWVYRIF